MKKKYLHLILVFTLLFAVFFVNLPAKSVVFADSLQPDTINYVSLGDSIADGVGLENYSSKMGNQLLDNTYAYLYQQGTLANKYSGINSLSFAVSGHQTIDLVDLLQNDKAIISSVQNADVISICIGANDILQIVKDQVAKYMISDVSLIPYLDSGIATFSENFPKVLNALNEINPNARKIFTSVYNPYKELMEATSDITINVSLGTGMTNTLATVTKAKLKEIGNLTETYLAGGQGVVGLNQRMSAFIVDGKDAVSGESVDIDNTNCFMVDSKTNFDNYVGSKRLVNVSILDNTTYTFAATEAEAKIQALIDPHPTAEGHKLIYNAFDTNFINNFAVVNFDFDGGQYNQKTNNVVILKRNIAPDIDITVPEKSGFRCDGWLNLGTATIWSETSAVLADANLQAVWIATYEITFNTSGGNAIDSQIIDYGEKIVIPATPIKVGSTDVFAGWYYVDDNMSQVFWDFENNVVTKDVALVAKWANTICLNNNLLKQPINNIRSVEFKIDIVSDNIQWYVNNNLQVGQNSNTFAFFAPEVADEYEIYCVVNGSQTKKYTVSIEYIEPTEIIVEVVTINDKNYYTFSIENGNYIDGSKCVWYATLDQFSDEAEVIGRGSTCTARIATSRKVYAIYNGGECVSNIIDVDPPMVMSTTIYIIIAAVAVIGLFVVVLTIISRKRFKNYY